MAKKTANNENVNVNNNTVITSEQALQMQLELGYSKNSEGEQIFTPFIMGRPGIGKSAIVRAFAKKHNLLLIDVRMSQHDSTDLKGIPHFDAESGIVKWVTADFIPVEGNKVLENKLEKEGFEGCLFFLDEVNRADSQTIQSIFEIVGDYKIGGHPLIKNTYVVAAGNLGSEDGTDAVDFEDTALNRRLIKIRFNDNLKDWLVWAESDNHIDKDILGFVKANPQYYYKKCADGRNITPANWDKLSQLFGSNKGTMDKKLITEIIGPNLIYDSANVFLEYLRDLEKIAGKDVIEKYDQIKDILKNYEMSRISMLNESVLAELKKSSKLKDNELENLAHYMLEINSSDVMVQMSLEIHKISKSILEDMGNKYPEVDDAIASALSRGFENR